MGLCLVIYDENGDDVAEVGVGPYSEFGALRDFVAFNLERQNAGSRFPTFMLHSDCDGEWSVEEMPKLIAELEAIIQEMRALPPAAFNASWQEQISKQRGFARSSALDSFITANCDPVLGNILGLARRASELRRPISFM
ncbi:MAG: Imm70 family immunity protein [Pseudomonadota bacterium]